jgi:hypothetical protein
MKLIKAGETIAARRRVYFDLRDATDGITPETGEGGGQPQISVNDAAWGNAGISTLTHLGNGRYYAELDAATVITAGTRVVCRYKSANTAETPSREDIETVAFDPFDISASINAVLTAAHGAGSWQQGTVSSGTVGGIGPLSASVPITANAAETFDFEIFIDGLNATAALAFTFSLKRSLEDSDNEALLYVWSGLGTPDTDGLEIWKGERVTVSTAERRAWASLTVEHGGVTLTDGLRLSVHATTQAMDMPPSPPAAPYVWQMDIWWDYHERTKLAGESFTLERTVTRESESALIP